MSNLIIPVSYAVLTEFKLGGRCAHFVSGPLLSLNQLCDRGNFT